METVVDANLAPRGVSLRLYAEISATLAEGFTLGDVLEREKLAAETWSDAEEIWNERLTDEEKGASLREELDRCMELAQERLCRPLPPLDRELSAWLDFLRIWSAEEQQLRMLADLGMRPADLIRLHRYWSRRMADEPRLMREAARILEAPPRELPIPLVAPPTLPPPLDDEEEARRRATREEGVVVAPEVVVAGDDVGPFLLTPLPDPPVEPPPTALVRGPSVAPPPMRSSSSSASMPAIRSSASSASMPAIRSSSSSASMPAVSAPSPPSVPPPVRGFSAAPGPPPSPPTAAVDDHLTAELSLLEYAHICAEIQVRPEGAETTFAKYGLADLGKREATNRAWQARLQGDPDEMAEFVAIYSRSIKHWKLLNKK